MLWWLADDRELSTAAREAIATPDAEVFVSSVSVWEIAIKRRAGRLNAPDNLIDELERERFTPLPLTAHHAWIAGHLEPHHADPFDRALVAQALSMDLRLVTRDARIPRYGADVLRA